MEYVLNIRFDPYIQNRGDDFLECSVFFNSIDGRSLRNRFTMDWRHYDDAESCLEDVLKFQTEYIQSAWNLIEVCIPNRNAYGNLVPGWTGHKTLLSATRTPVALEEKPVTPTAPRPGR